MGVITPPSTPPEENQYGGANFDQSVRGVELADAGHLRNTLTITHTAEGSTTTADASADSAQAGDCRPPHPTWSAGDLTPDNTGRGQGKEGAQNAGNTSYCRSRIKLTERYQSRRSYAFKPQ
jgi:hypothetical protein